MNLVRALVVGLALLQGAWLLYDGSRAFIVGDYMTRTSGPRAGELGPWSLVVSAIGLAPRGSVMKAVHVSLGLTWLTTAIAFIMRRRLARRLALVCSVAGLWYLPIGTATSVVVLGLMLTRFPASAGIEAPSGV